MCGFWDLKVDRKGPDPAQNRTFHSPPGIGLNNLVLHFGICNNIHSTTLIMLVCRKLQPGYKRLLFPALGCMHRWWSRCLGLSFEIEYRATCSTRDWVSYTSMSWKDVSYTIDDIKKFLHICAFSCCRSFVMSCKLLLLHTSDNFHNTYKPKYMLHAGNIL